MGTIAIKVEVEEALIEAGIPRGKWAEYVNGAALRELEKKRKGKVKNRVRINFNPEGIEKETLKKLLLEEDKKEKGKGGKR